jgi:hypothetical protein
MGAAAVIGLPNLADALVAVLDSFASLLAGQTDCQNWQALPV